MFEIVYKSESESADAASLRAAMDVIADFLDGRDIVIDDLSPISINLTPVGAQAMFYCENHAATLTFNIKYEGIVTRKKP